MLALCDGGNYAAKAVEAYRGGAEITREGGRIRLTLLLLDALAPSDPARILQAVRKAAAGEGGDRTA